MAGLTRSQKRNARRARRRAATAEERCAARLDRAAERLSDEVRAAAARSGAFRREFCAAAAPPCPLHGSHAVEATYFLCRADVDLLELRLDGRARHQML